MTPSLKDFGVYSDTHVSNILLVSVDIIVLGVQVTSYLRRHDLVEKRGEPLVQFEV